MEKKNNLRKKGNEWLRNYEKEKKKERPNNN